MSGRLPRSASAVLRASSALAGLWLFLVAVAVLLGNAGTPILAWSGLIKLAGALAAAFTFALAFYPALGLERRPRLVALLLWSAPLLLVPLLFGPDERVMRVPVAIVALVLLFKLYDVHLSVGRGKRPDAWAFLSFLSVPVPLLLREVGAGSVRAGSPPSRDLWIAGMMTAVGALLFIGSLRIDWSPWHFLVEHAAKGVGFFLVFTGSAAVVASLVRRAGGRFPEFTDRPFLARTPGEFWRRYNLPIGRFLYEDVFIPTGGRRYPALGIMAAFAVSALGHEYIFSIAVGRVQGYQTAFFLLNGLAVAATTRMRPRGALVPAARLATMSFLLVSSVLFFMSLQSLVPFYTEVPAWLVW